MHANKEIYETTFAFVYWFLHPSPQSPTLKLHEIVKEYWDGGHCWACGIVLLRSIIYPCTLVPVLPGFLDGSINQHNAFSQHEQFFINPYGSQAEWRCHNLGRHDLLLLYLTTFQVTNPRAFLTIRPPAAATKHTMVCLFFYNSRVDMLILLLTYILELYI